MRLACFMCGLDTVGSVGEKGARAVGTRLLCRDADRRSRCVRWTQGLWEQGILNSKVTLYRLGVGVVGAGIGCDGCK